MHVRFWGTRGSIATPGPDTLRFGGNTSCVEVTTSAGACFILDCGTGARALGAALMARGPKPLTATILLSHTHWDHIQGFPFFKPVYVPGNAFCVYTAAPGATDMYALLSGQMRSDYFPVNLKDLRADIATRTLSGAGDQIGAVTVRSFELYHPGTSYALSFEMYGHKVVYATDNEIDLTLPNREEVAKDLSPLRAVPRGFLEFIRGADLLVADGQYTDAEYTDKIGWGHSRATTAVDAAVLAGVEQLAVYHHDPMQSDADVDAKIRTCQERALRFGSPLSVLGAREGLALRIG
jgi:phosphoribosyl 1,2-cyclic phosphodiesterase